MISQCSYRLFSLLGFVFITSSSLAGEHGDEHDSIVNKQAISEQLAQYSYRWDGKDSEGFAELFSADGVMERWLNGSVVVSKRILFSDSFNAEPGRPAIEITRE